MTNEEKRSYLLRFHRFQKSREKHFAPLILAAIRSQYDTLLSDLKQGYTEQQALQKIDSSPVSKVLKSLYVDAGTIYGAKVRSDLNKLVPYRLQNPNSFTQIKNLQNHTFSGKNNSHILDKNISIEMKARMPMGFSEEMRQLIEQYFSIDILNQSEGITETTRELIRQVFTDAYAKGEGIDDIIAQLKDTELSRVRSRLIARTETVTAANQGSLFVAKSTGLELNKEWLSASDSRVRMHHRHLNGQIVGIDDFFHDHGVTLKVPGARVQENGLPVPASFVVNCRCTTLYVPVD